jgi:hypothetical protein
VTSVATALRARVLIASAVSGLVLLGAVATPVSAATTYRYWSYWIGTDTTGGAPQWGYAVEGAGTRVPVDGDVEGWRFGLAARTSDIYPDTLPDFASICAEVDPSDDSKRIAVVVDPGEPADAPDGETPGPLTTTCVVAELSATSLDILQTVATVRTDAGFVCGIDGYPAIECAPLVDEPVESAVTSSDITPKDVTQEGAAQQGDSDRQNTDEVDTTAASPDTSGSGTPLITAAVVSSAAIIGFGLWRRSRRVRQS